MSKFIVLDSEKVFFALHDAGVIVEEPASIRRLVIDLEVGSPARIYVEKYADDKKLHAGVEAALRVEQATAAPGELR